MQRGFLVQLIRSDKTVFSFKDILLLWGNIDKMTAASRINYYVKTGALYHIRRGLYAKDKNYDKLEMATRIFTPSYISFETVLGTAGLIFQYYDNIFVASYQSKEIVCDGQKISFKKIKDSILTSKEGIERRENYSIATPERAFLDTLYIHKKYYFDSLSGLDWNKIYEILPIYQNNRYVKNEVEKWHELAKKNIK